MGSALMPSCYCCFSLTDADCVATMLKKITIKLTIYVRRKGSSLLYGRHCRESSLSLVLDFCGLWGAAFAEVDTGLELSNSTKDLESM